MHYAHSLHGRSVAEWQTLEDHLNQTAVLAERFATDFAPGYGRIAGLWHDIGKYQRAFQDYIGQNPDGHVRGGVDHS
jgi:CRISPR-associated endonuclease/helicase Cas3